MIFFMLCRAGNHTIRNSYLYDFPGMRGRVQVVNYEGAVRQPVFPRGCYVFTDLDRASPGLMRGIVAFYDFLGTLGSAVRRINHPTLSMRRYDLLRTLHERGTNDFDAYRAGEERQPVRYPVFLRRENGHDGPLSRLLRDPRELTNALRKVRHFGIDLRDVLIVEFCDVRGPDGLVRKYGAFYVDGIVVPRHLVISKDWVAKFTDFKAIAPILSLEAQLEEEARYVEENPHAAEVRAVFETARIGYGRIDYSIKNGAIRIWEINTNPVIAESRNVDGSPRHRRVLEPGVRRLAEAMLRLDADLPAQPWFRIEPTIEARLAAGAS